MKNAKLAKIETKSNILNSRSRRRSNRGLFIIILIAVLSGAGMYIIYRSILYSAIVLLSLVVICLLFAYFRRILIEAGRIKRMESVFPDFLGLMASNLRAGMTISRAMLLSAREEFSPLDKEILRVGKDITTGKDTESALLDMSKRIGSEKIAKTLLLVISGIKAGGNISVLLEDTAVNMRERGFVEKRAGSNVLMYIIFIFIAVAVAAPALFSLSNILVGVLTSLLSGLSVDQTTSARLPFTMSSINISTNFILLFSLTFMLMLDILASLVLGLVSKGEEKEGLRYFVPILMLSYGIFFAVKIFLSNFMKGLF